MKYSSFFVIFVILKGCFTEESFRFVLSLINSGNCSPVINNNEDIFKEKWTKENSYQLTSLGARMQYFLGVRNSKKYKGDFISTEYLNKELYAASENNSCSYESLYSHLLGMFPVGTGDIINEDKKSKAFPPNINNKDVRILDILEKLSNNALMDRSNVFKIHSFQNSDILFGLQKQSKCNGVDGYKERYIDQSNFEKKLQDYKDSYTSILKSNNIIKDDLSLNNAIILCETLIKNKEEGRFPSILKGKLDENEFTRKCEDLLSDYKYNILYDDSVKYISRVASTKFINKLLSWLNDRIEKDTKGIKDDYLPYASPKYVVFSLEESSFISITKFISHSLNIEDRKFMNSSSVQFELLLKNTDLNPSINDFNVRILFNDDQIYYKRFNDFKVDFTKKLILDSEIDSFCGFENSSYTIYIVISSILLLTFISMVIFLICLKCRRDKYLKQVMKIMSNDNLNNEVNKSNVKTDEKLN